MNVTSVDAPAPRRVIRLTRLAGELAALIESSEPAQVDGYELARFTLRLEADLAQLRTALLGGVR